MDPRFAHITRLDLRSRQLLVPGRQPPVRADRRADDRLYRASARRWTRVEARRVQKMHFHGSGTTLAGLMKHHDVDPHHFMGDVHDVPLDRVAARRPPGRGAARGCRAASFVHTNGDADYAWKVLDASRRAASIRRPPRHLRGRPDAEARARTAIASCCERSVSSRRARSWSTTWPATSRRQSSSE